MLILDLLSYVPITINTKVGQAIRRVKSVAPPPFIDFYPYEMHWNLHVGTPVPVELMLLSVVERFK